MFNFIKKLIHPTNKYDLLNEELKRLHKQIYYLHHDGNMGRIEEKELYEKLLYEISFITHKLE